MLDEISCSLDELLKNISIKCKYVKGDSFLKELCMEAQEYLWKEHVVTDCGGICML